MSDDSTQGRRFRIGRRVRTVDIHSHVYVDVSDLTEAHDPIASKTTNPFQAAFLHLTSVEDRLHQMDKHDIDIQVVSLVPSYNYWAEAELSEAIVSRQNEQIATLCSTHPERFVPFGTLSLQYPEMAARQMVSLAKEYGMRGFEIGCSVNGDELSDSKFAPFWAKAEELNALIFLHPAGVKGDEEQLQGNGYLNNVIGHPLETTVALSHLIFEGTLDRYPGLKICAAHGGGFLASYLGRSEHCAEFSERCKPVKMLPKQYFGRQIYCDSIVFTPEGLRHLVAEIGADHVLLGTDFPFDVGAPHMGDPKAVDLILAAPGISAVDREKILGSNAAKLLRLP